jgi:hypothetical protein
MFKCQGRWLVTPFDYNETPPERGLSLKWFLAGSEFNSCLLSVCIGSGPMRIRCSYLNGDENSRIAVSGDSRSANCTSCGDASHLVCVFAHKSTLFGILPIRNNNDSISFLLLLQIDMRKAVRQPADVAKLPRFCDVSISLPHMKLS